MVLQLLVLIFNLGVPSSPHGDGTSEAELSTKVEKDLIIRDAVSQ